MRLIDADELKKVFADVARHLAEEGKDVMGSMFIAAAAYVDAQPTVSQILQCKDCKYYEKNTFGMKSKDKMFCSKCGGLTRNSGEDFCSYGEKRTKEADK